MRRFKRRRRRAKEGLGICAGSQNDESPVTALRRVKYVVSII